HTRSDRDWSSDVCSSDLTRFPQELTNQLNVQKSRTTNPMAWASHEHRRNCDEIVRKIRGAQSIEELHEVMQGIKWKHGNAWRNEIGRASCRERVEIWVSA